MTDLGDDHVRDEPFHDGEIAVQERAGERDLARRHGRPSRRGSSLAPCRFWRGSAFWRCLPPETTGTCGRLWCGQPGFVLRSADGHA
jgi:hypothetical protein